MLGNHIWKVGLGIQENNLLLAQRLKVVICFVIFIDLEISFKRHKKFNIGYLFCLFICLILSMCKFRNLIF
jgi:hypothetical protein